MHNCNETRERLIETVLDGIDGADEFDGCLECRAEFAALNATLRMTRRLGETEPDEKYWPVYHARLRQKLLTSAGISHVKAQRCKQDAEDDRVSALRLLFAPLRLCVRTTVRVPVPLLVLAVLVLAVLGLFAARGARQHEVQSPVVVHVPVEVPVVQEKVVTRIVYRDRYLPSRASRRAINDAPVESTFARSRKPTTEEIPASLTGFKPTEEIKLIVLKGGAPK